MNYHNEDLLYYIHQNNIIKFKDLILDNSIDIVFNNNKVMQLSIELGRTEIVELLLSDPRIDPAFNNNLFIMLSSELGHVSIVKLLLADPRVNPAEDKNWPIIFAAEHGHIEIVKLLLADPRVDCFSQSGMAVKQSIKSGYTDITALLLKEYDRFKDVNINSIILFAAEDGDFDTVSFLLSKENANFDNYTIYLASQNGHTEIVKLLIRDERSNPSYCNNAIIKNLKKLQYFDMIDLLWTHQSIKNTLKIDDVDLFNELTLKNVQKKINNFTYHYGEI